MRESFVSTIDIRGQNQDLPRNLQDQKLMAYSVIYGVKIKRVKISLAGL